MEEIRKEEVKKEEVKKESRRVKMTKRVIKDSFFELLKKTPINKITVKMISESADVNRGTFYAYYKDPYDLLEKTEQELYDAVKYYFRNYRYDNDSSDALNLVFTYMEKEIEFSRAMFSKNGDPDFMKKLLYIVHDETIKGWSIKYPAQSRHALEMAYNYTVSGSVGVIRDWIFDDGGLSPKELSEYLCRMWEQGMRSLEV